MAEIQKYNLVEKLAEADEKFKNSPALVGSSGMTFAPYNNSTRTNMFTSHMNQFLNIVDPRFSHVFTGMENVAGENSSGYKKTKGKIKVYRKVYKFEELTDHPYFYQMFYWDYKKERYDVVERKYVEDLGQDFGYKCNNTVIDNLDEGEEVPEGTVLTRSNSYSDTMDYRYGRDILVGYTFDPGEYEDAATIAESCMDSFKSIISSVKRVGWNNNDVPLNIYGGDDEYRPLPWIGEEVTGVVTSSRPFIREQVLHDFKKENLMDPRDDGRSIYINGKGIVVDYDILLNNPDIERNRHNAQLLQLLDSQNRYWKRIQDTCIEIAKSGKKYSRAIDELYAESKKYLERNPKRKWHNGTSVFGNVEIHMHIVEESKLWSGGKFTARFGNKSVVAKVVPDYMMPFTKDGRHIQVLLAVPAVPNRTTGFVPHELGITWLMSHCRQEMAKKETRKEKEDLMWDLVDRLNHRQYEDMHAKYMTLTDEEKDRYIQNAIEDGIYSHQDMILEDESIFFKLKKAFNELPYATVDTLYLYRFGHVYRCYQKYRLGTLYLFPLKQTDKRGFSVRATGAINLKGLPERSYKNKRSEAPFSDTAIRFGEYEALTEIIGMSSEDLVAVQALYRTSPEASEDLTKAQFDKDCIGKFRKFYKSRPAEINNVYMRHLGFDPTFIDVDNEVRTINARSLRTHIIDGKSYICTDYDAHIIGIRSRIRAEVLSENPIIDKIALDKLVDIRMAETPILSKPYDGKPIFDDPEILAEPDVSCGWTYRKAVKQAEVSNTEDVMSV